MSRKQTPPDVITTVRLPRELHGRVMEMAKREQRTLAGQIRLSIEQHLEKEAA